MKGTELVRLVASLFVVFLSISGCRTAPPPVVRNNMDELIRSAANQAAKYADEAKTAQQKASQLSDAAEIRALLDEANVAAQEAQNYADEAAELQSQIDDAALKNQVADAVATAQAAAEQAAAQRAAINRFMLTIRKETIHASLDDATNRIVQQVEFTGSGSGDDPAQLMDEIVSGTFCDLFVDTVATGELPTEAEVLEAVQENAEDSALTISGVYDIVSKEVVDEFRALARGKTLDELKDFKDACEAVLEER